jgi:CshA-type fibril repeat protein
MRIGRRSGVVVLVAAIPLLGVAGPALAEGSATLYPVNATCQPNSAGGSCRASIEWRQVSYGPASAGPIKRRTVFSVYATAGEVVLLGSSAVGVGAGDITVYDPGVVTDESAEPLPTVTSGTNGFVCSVQRSVSGDVAQGVIASRAEELAGPRAVSGGGNPTGYDPCSYVAPSTGIYKVVLYGPDGEGATADGGPTGDITLAGAGNFTAAQGSSVAAWDITVRATATSTTDIPGRLFAYAVAAFTGGNGRPLNQTMYVTTTDGFRYRASTNGLDPNGFLMYGNERGFLDADGQSPLDHDIVGTTSSSQLTGLAGGVALAAPEYPLSFTPLAPEVLAALAIPSVPTPPTLSSFAFAGSIASNNSTVGAGGQFTFTSNVHSEYEIVISRGVDFDPGNPLNKVLRGIRAAGAQTVAWDGRDNAGNPFPVGTGYQAHARLHVGEYHFPLLDAESSTKGGPTLTLLNPPGGVCPFGNPACTTAFYDDRGYHTLGSTGVDVGTPGSALCGLQPPATDHSDPLTGYDSASTQRSFGSDTGGNTNVPCTGAFGDVKGLDTWAFYPSPDVPTLINIVGSVPPGPVAAPDSGTTPADTPLVVPVAGSVLGNDSGTGITVTSTTQPSHGTIAVAADGSYVYTPDPGYSGPDTFTYTITDSLGRTASAPVLITVTPVALPESATTPMGTPVTLSSAANDIGTGLTVTAVTQPAAGTGSVAIVGGKPVYTPPPGFVGVITFTYTVTDASGQTATAVDTVTVTPVAPAAAPDSRTTPQGVPVTVNVLLNDDPHGASFDVTSVRLLDPASGTYGTQVTIPGQGTYTVDVATGLVTFTPLPTFTGVATPVRYRVTDNHGLTASSTLTITVTPSAVTPPPAPAPGEPGQPGDAGGTLPGTGADLGPMLLTGFGLLLLGGLALAQRATGGRAAAAMLRTMGPKTRAWKGAIPRQ